MLFLVLKPFLTFSFSASFKLIFNDLAKALVSWKEETLIEEVKRKERPEK